MFLRYCLRLGEIVQMWLKKFTIAIVEKNVELINSLMDEMPQFETQSDIESALSLIQEAKKFLESLQRDTQNSMIQLQKNIKFLKSTQAPLVSKLDVSS